MNRSLQSSKNMRKISRNQVMSFTWALQPLIVTILSKSRVEGTKGSFKQLFEQESKICFECPAGLLLICLCFYKSSMQLIILMFMSAQIFLWAVVLWRHINYILTSIKCWYVEICHIPLILSFSFGSTNAFQFRRSCTYIIIFICNWEELGMTPDSWTQNQKF